MHDARPDRKKVEQWNRILKPYWGADRRSSITQILNSAIPFVLLWYAAYRSLEVGFWLTALLAIPMAGFMMRLFIIQHDCGHGSFFNSRKARDWTGRVIGVLLLTPYDYWRKTHAYHHAHSGDLDFRGFGDVDTITVQEYLDKPLRERVYYRIYRNPLVLFLFGPIFLFVFKHRFPFDVPWNWKSAWKSVFWTNVAIAGVLAVASVTIGLKTFLLVQGPATVSASVIGVWLFYVQHQFEHTYWNWHEQWDYYDASLLGSSYLALPAPFQWISGNIGVHHVHHMSARIPNYKLQKAHDENPEFHVVTKMRFRDTFRLINLSLWDEESDTLIRFKDLRRLKKQGARKRAA
jgi:acyl-lipid omega-6 desaturase (Delta-12 desaturase)